MSTNEGRTFPIDTTVGTGNRNKRWHSDDGDVENKDDGGERIHSSVTKRQRQTNIEGSERDGTMDEASDVDEEDNVDVDEDDDDDGDDDDVDTWDEELHDRFISAIFDIGLRKASPAIILENMTQRLDSITSERVKSKLQKYRNSKDKSRQEFMDEYRSFLQRVKAIEAAGAIDHHAGGGGGASTIGPTSLLEIMGSTKLLGGDLAGFLTYSVSKQKEASGAGETAGTILSSRILRQGADEYIESFAGSPIPFPVLSEQEKKSPLGVAMTFVMGLFLSMSQHLTRERAKAESLYVTHASTTTERINPTAATAGTILPAAASYGGGEERGVGGTMGDSGDVQSQLMGTIPIAATALTKENGPNNVAMYGQSLGSIPTAPLLTPDSIQ